MTLGEAAQVLKERGLVVQVNPPDSITATAQPYEPPPEFKARGVTDAYSFGFSIYRVGDEWAFRHSAPRPAEWFADVGSALEHALAYCDEVLPR
jgi:hypothetical protein